jgi:hypothetical protein
MNKQEFVKINKNFGDKYGRRFNTYMNPKTHDILRKHNINISKLVSVLLDDWVEKNLKGKTNERKKSRGVVTKPN